MRKFILTGMAVAMLSAVALPSVASADVQRYQEQTGTITANVHVDGHPTLVHKFAVKINPCDGSFSGTGESHQGPFDIDETITGTLKGGKVDFDAQYLNAVPGYKWGTQDAGTLGTEIPAWDDWNSVFTVNVTANVTDSTHYKNHGEFVKQSADKNDAAHSCIGMPVNSSK